MITTLRSSTAVTALFVGMSAILIGLFILSLPVTLHAAILERQLEITMTGSDVSSLQTYLAQDAALYPQGLVTGYFGFLTKAAVSNYQDQNGIAAVGRVGPVTLASLNAKMSGGGSVSNGDEHAALIYNVSVSTGRNGATVNWNTTELAKGAVYFDTAPLSEYEYQHSVAIGGSVASTDNALRSSQSVTIGGLQSNTTYYYDIYVTDAAGNVSMTVQTSFRTTN